MESQEEQNQENDQENNEDQDQEQENQEEQEQQNENQVKEQVEQEEHKETEEEVEQRSLVRRLSLKEKELYDQFTINEQEIKALMSDQENQKLYMSDLIVFKDKFNDIIGVELDSFINYVVTYTNLRNTKFALTFSEVRKYFIYWLDWSYKERNRDFELEEKERKRQLQLQEEEDMKLQKESEKF